MARKLYPIGIQTFERIRQEDMFYVDKTAYVYHMTHTDGKYFFLAAHAVLASRYWCRPFKVILRGNASRLKALP